MRRSTWLVLIAMTGVGCSWMPWRKRIDPATVHGGVSIHGDALPAKTVALTYDDGPDEHTLEIARYLHDNGIRATFFVNGRRFCRSFAADGSCAVPAEIHACNDGTLQAPVASPRHYPESWLKELVALGHRVGNHTQDHCDLTDQMVIPDLAWEFEATQALLDKYIPDGVFLFRAPFGVWDLDTALRANQWPGFARLTGPVNWDIDGNDWNCWKTGMTPAQCADKYLAKLTERPKQNGIVLMHDRPEFNVGYEGPLLLTKILVPRLREGGYSFATLDEVVPLSRASTSAR